MKEIQRRRREANRRASRALCPYNTSLSISLELGARKKEKTTSQLSVSVRKEEMSARSF
jgi:hypothetical protein